MIVASKLTVSVYKNLIKLMTRVFQQSLRQPLISAAHKNKYLLTQCGQ